MKTKLRLAIIYVLPTIFLLLFSAKAHTATIYVNLLAGGANNGSSWLDAYTDLSDALAAAVPGDEIWVAEGVYIPSITYDFNGSGGIDPREAVFTVPDGVKLYGGFTGTELTLDERDFEANLTILSGDIDVNDANIDGNFIAEDSDDINGSNAYHVIYTHNVGTNTEVNGFVITGGSADLEPGNGALDPNRDGGGWYNQLSPPINESSPVIRNVTFQGNYALSEGGAIYNTPGPTGSINNTLIESCRFYYNKSDNAGGAIYIGSFDVGTYGMQISHSDFTGNEAYRRGGALYLLGDESSIDSCNFTNNMVTVVSMDMGTLPGSGGAVSMVTSNASFLTCYFENNSATGNPTGAYEGGGGGAIYMSTNEPQTEEFGGSAPEFINCGFYYNYAGGNTTAWGGAIVHLNDGGILNPSYINCVFSHNQATNDGGAIATFTRVIGAPSFTPEIDPSFTNCTFFANDAGDDGGAIYSDGWEYSGSEILNLHLENSILWQNTAGGSGPEILNDAAAYITYSLVQGSGGSGGGWDTSLGTDGGNNVHANPGFANATDPIGMDLNPGTADDGLRLVPTSSVANAGNNTAAGLSGISFDYIGANRIQGGNVSMGAYERLGIIIPELEIFWVHNWPDFDPPCLFCPRPWSFLFLDRYLKDSRFNWLDKAQLVVGENEAIVKGTIVNIASPDIAFLVNIKLVKPMNWQEWSKQGGSYFAYTKEAVYTARKHHVNWMFWELSDESYLEGAGKLEGKVSLRSIPSFLGTGFQFGKGANAFDSDPGMGGSFIYEGKLQYHGNSLKFTGLGSMYVDVTPCESDCNLDVTRKSLSLNDEDHYLIQETNEEALEFFNTEPSFAIYPTPARDRLKVDMHSMLAGYYQVKILNVSGKEVFSGYIEQAEGVHTIELNGFNSGMYIIRLISEDQQMLHKTFIVE